MWFPEQRDARVDRRFYTLLQESFYRAYCQLDVGINDHRRLHRVALRVAVGGVPILPFFERYPRLPSLLSERDRYIRECVQVFYATLFVKEDQMFIEFMFQERRWRLSRERLATFLGVRISDEPRLLYYLAYGDTEPPPRPHDTRFPSDDEVSVLFQQSFLPGTLRTPEKPTPLAHTVHLAL
jgi:hypothetical protein